MEPSDLFGIAALFVVATVICWYILFAPYRIYARSDGAEKGCFFILNLCFGITGLGWFILLLVALNEANRRRRRC